MSEEVRIHANFEEGVRWWAESDSGFTGGSDLLSDLVATVQEWAAEDGIEVDFVLVAHESFSGSDDVEPVIRRGPFAEPASSEGGMKPKIIQMPVGIPA